MKKNLYHVNKLWLLLYLFIMFYQLIVNGTKVALSKNLTVLSIIIVVLGPYLIKKVFKYKMSEELKFLYFSFIFVALILGCIYNFYRTISWFDLFAHFLSGIMTSIVALIILKRFNLLKKNLLFFDMIFIVSFTLLIASCWEFFEFFSDKIFKSDCQWVLLTGVDDTMGDMLISSLASIIFSLVFYILIRRDSKTLKRIDNML